MGALAPLRLISWHPFSRQGRAQVPPLQVSGEAEFSKELLMILRHTTAYENVHLKDAVARNGPSPEGATQESPGRKPWEREQPQRKPLRGVAVSVSV